MTIKTNASFPTASTNRPYYWKTPDIPPPQLCWLLGAAFSYAGERKAVRYDLPHLWLARAGIAISTLPVLIFTGIVLYANLA